MFLLSIMYSNSTVCAMRGAKVRLFIELTILHSPKKAQKQVKRQTFKII